MRCRKHAKLGIIILSAVAMILLGGMSTLASPSGDSSAMATRATSLEAIDLDYAPGQVIVKFSQGLGAEQMAEVGGAAGVEAVLQEIAPREGERIYLLKLESDVTVESAVEQLNASPRIVYAEPNYRLELTYTPNDPRFAGEQWGYNNTGQTIEGVPGTPDADIDAVEGWNLEQGFSNTTNVAVIDSGIDLSHPDLQDKLWVNSGEIPDNGIDDDGNGFIDDYNGYNWAGISQYSATSYPWLFGANINTQLLEQSITGTGCDLTSIAIVLQKVGNPTQPITVSVRNSRDGADLASATIAPSEVPSSANIIDKTLSGVVKLNSGTTYYLAFNTSQLDASDYYLLYDNWNEGFDWYKEGSEWQWEGSTSTWNNDISCDFFFKTNANFSSHDDNGHGTHCSGIVGAHTNNSIGVAGTSPGARIMALKAGDCSGSLFTTDWIQAIYYAADNGADITSMSFGGTSSSTAAQDAIDYAYLRGVTQFASSGNSGDSTMQYPAGYNHIVGIGATNNQDGIASFSTHNSSVDISSPGVSVMSTMPTYAVGLNEYGYTQNYSYMNGTSMACPMAAGLGALVHSRNPNYTNDVIQQTMQDNADDKGAPGRDDYFGYGRINAYKTLNNVTPAFTVTASVSGGHGVVSPLSQVVDQGGTATINITPDTGYKIGSITDNGNPVAEPYPNPYVIGNVQESHDVVVTFAPSGIFYFAEGYTGEGFEEYLCLQNPNAAPTTAHITYMFSDGSTQTQDVPLGPTTRETVNVNSIVGAGKNVSMKVEADDFIVAERPMYFSYKGSWTGGHDVIGANSPGTTFYFAEGTTRGGFEEYLCLQNPNTAPTTAHITYMFADGSTQGQDVPIGPTTRETVNVNSIVGPGRDVSITILSDSPIVAERPMYFNRYIGYVEGYGDITLSGGHDVIGAASPGTTFYFAEGYTGVGFEEWLCLANPNAAPTTAHVTYMFADGSTQTQDVPIGPTTRQTVEVNSVVGLEQNVSMKVEADSPIVAERPMYFFYKMELYLDLWSGGHDVVGASSPQTSFYFAEGYTGEGFEEYLCLANPNAAPTTAHITYMFSDGSTQAQDVPIGPTTRETVNVNSIVGAGRNVSITIAADDPIVAERPMYFVYKGAWTGGHDVIGFTP
jgi:subtilisin family serine protease